jgi:lysozyme
VCSRLIAGNASVGFLSAENREALIAELETQDESLRLRVYDDATGKPITKGSVVLGHPTIGIGRALDVNGITRPEALYLCGNDIDKVEAGIAAALPWVSYLDGTRQRVLCNMSINLGVAGLMQFHDMLRLLQDGRYELASLAMKDSKWYSQVGQRGVRLVARMRGGDAGGEVA